MNIVDNKMQQRNHDFIQKNFLFLILQNLQNEIRKKNARVTMMVWLVSDVHSTPSFFPDATNALFDKILTQSLDAMETLCGSKYKLKTELYNYT